MNIGTWLAVFVEVLAVGTRAYAQGGNAGRPPATASPSSPSFVELLHAVPAVVAVSSAIENGTEVPWALVDHNPETAWSARTGELNRAWIAIRLPAAVRVEAIKLTVGYTHRDRTHRDLFTANYRVQHVRVFRNGSAFGEFDLDINQRGLQSIPIHAQGGDFRLELSNVVAGTERHWREVCVSELEVWGSTGASSTPSGAPASQPRFALGSLDDTRLEPIYEARIDLRVQRRALESGHRDCVHNSDDPEAPWMASEGCAYDDTSRLPDVRRAGLALARLICHPSAAFDAAAGEYEQSEASEASSAPAEPEFATAMSHVDADNASTLDFAGVVDACGVHDPDLQRFVDEAPR